VTAPLPAIASVTDSLPEARYPGFKGIMAAKKKPIETLTAADLGLAVADDSRDRSIVVEVAQRPPREAGTTVVDDGTAAQQLADYLANADLI
jgi:electron transfer flavoprotein beta subunit